MPVNAQYPIPNRATTAVSITQRGTRTSTQAPRSAMAPRLGT
jgi:hypothetical protein